MSKILFGNVHSAHVDFIDFIPVDSHKYINFVIFRFRYIFLEYAAPNHALEAVKNADGYKLDKQHTFRVNLFTDFDK